jgi:O-antigen/teichoic acid export membrane protein
VFENINVLIIGRFFPAAQLGYYTKAKQFQQIASGQILQAISVVAFPVFSIIQDDKERLQQGIMKFLQQGTLVVFPIIITLFVVAESFVILFLTSKWESMIIYLKLFCVIGAIFPINAINGLVLVAQGYSKLNFKMTVIKNILRVLNVVVMYRFGVLYIVVGEVAISFLSVFINTWYTKKYLNYGVLKQLVDIKYQLIGALVALLSGLLVNMIFTNLYVLFLFGGLATFGTFLLFQYFFNRELLEIAIEFKNKIFKKLKSE